MSGEGPHGASREQGATRGPAVGLPKIGDVVAERYRIERVVGRGGMAHVLAARHVTLGGGVAIKILDPSLAADAEAKERFAREAKAMARLKSANTVRVHDVGFLPSGLPYMVMELLEGKDLDRLLAERGPLPFADVCTYIEQACEAIDEAHRAGFVHRDLKPHNLFLTEVNGKPFIRVLDFGIARAVSSQEVEGGEALTRAGDIVGTYAYMAPEQIRSASTVDARTDVWSLGVCLYRLITKSFPFEATGEAALLVGILTKAPKPLSVHRRDVPLALGGVIMRCLRKPPAERFGSADELRAALADARSLLISNAEGEETDEATEIMRPASASHPSLPGNDAHQRQPSIASLPKLDDGSDGPIDRTVALDLRPQTLPMRASSPQHTMPLPQTPAATSQPVHVRPAPPPPARPQALAHPGPPRLEAAEAQSILPYVLVAVVVALTVVTLGIIAFFVLSQGR